MDKEHTNFRLKDRTCSVTLCQNKHYALDLCQKHYIRLKNHGDLNKRSQKGRKFTEDHRHRLSLSKIGKKMTEKQKRHLSEVHLKRESRFYKRSEETKENLRKLRKGMIPWNKGIKRFDIRGEKHPRWNGGGGGINHLVRNSFEYKAWRTAIFQRDNYTCQICSIRGGVDLHVDHYPKSFASLMRDNNIKSVDEAVNCSALWDLDSNRTLCVNCHKTTPNYLKNVDLENNISINTLTR